MKFSLLYACFFVSFSSFSFFCGGGGGQLASKYSQIQKCLNWIRWGERVVSNDDGLLSTFYWSKVEHGYYHSVVFDVIIYNYFLFSWAWGCL